MSAQIIDGKAFAAKVRGQVAEHVTRIKEKRHHTGIGVVLVGKTQQAKSMCVQRANKPLKRA